MVGEGVPPSNREIRELLLPVIDDLPERDDFPDGFRLVLREIDRFLATASSRGQAVGRARAVAEVKEAARLLAGRSVVLIGGNRRREAQESLRRALGLKDLVWIETKEHQAVDDLRAADRPPGCGSGLAGHPLVEPRVWRCEADLRPPRQAAGATAGRLQPQPGRRPDPLAMQRAARSSSVRFMSQLAIGGEGQFFGALDSSGWIGCFIFNLLKEAKDSRPSRQ